MTQGIKSEFKENGCRPGQKVGKKTTSLGGENGPPKLENTRNRKP